MGQTLSLFDYFRPLSQYNDKYSTNYDYKSIDGVLGLQTQYHRMVIADEYTELWRPRIFF